MKRRNGNLKVVGIGWTSAIYSAGLVQTFTRKNDSDASRTPDPSDDSDDSNRVLTDRNNPKGHVSDAKSTGHKACNPSP